MCIAYGILTISKAKERWQSWSNASDLKSEDALRYPWVRIPLSPYLDYLIRYYYFFITSFYAFILTTLIIEIRKKNKV